MYALLEELWNERNELKRTIATFQGSVSSDDLLLQKNDEINQPGIEAESRPGDLTGKSDGVLSLPDGRGVDYQCATGSLIDVYGGKDEYTASSYNVKSSPYSHSLRDVGLHSTSSSSYSTNPQQLTTTQYHYPHTTTKLFSKPFAPSSSGDIQLGMVVLVTRARGQIGRGVVKYVGPLPGRQDTYIGVELGQGQGRHTFVVWCFYTCLN
ncbi:hypothetical protein OS493_009538 [Desmophyllum pertusum]|uniref:CAP-Gly domain-containing protein n=1 Tax=Desmophyllum pertusum TaxID=174260 RepID=A0A9W9YQS8_9CNID|nr:hypothetical protein OS493_009538 [Desmophyllum pertusum]